MCKLPKSEDQFYRKGKKLQSRCKECKKLYNHDHYKANKDIYLANRDAWRNSRRQKVAEMKRAVGCTLCPEREPCCLDFHHTDSDLKEFEISAKIDCAWEDIVAEIEKCVVLCKNCHTKVHHGLVVCPGKGVLTRLTKKLLREGAKF
jgi:hypothetical protein